MQCAVLGGSLQLLKWLVDEHCCPLRSIRISNGKQRDSSGSYTPILTSKGRSLLGIALGNRNIGIVRYLVVEKRMLLSGEKDLCMDDLIQNLDLALRVLPEEILDEQIIGHGQNMPEIPASSSLGICGQSDRDINDSSDHAPDFATIKSRSGDDNSTGSLEDAVSYHPLVVFLIHLVVPYPFLSLSVYYLLRKQY